MSRTRRLALFTSLALACLVLPAPGASAAPTCFGKRATIVGTRGPDKLRGTAHSDVIVGGRGNDVITGGGGKDYICGGGGNDRLGGGGGDDRISGGAGDDRMAGGAGNFDLLRGEAGDDHYSGGPGRLDYAIFSKSPVGVTADLTAGTATGEGSDTLTGIEALGGSKQNDTFTGDANTNFFVGSDGDDTITGGDGKDAALFFTADAPVTADLAKGTATGEGNDSLAELEGLGGSQFDDTLSGDAADNVLFGFLGNDTLDGGPGDDILAGHDGDDAIDGGPGTNDWADYIRSDAPITADLAAGTATGQGNDTLTRVEGLRGSDSADSLTGDDDDNSIFGSAGDDTIAGGAGDDRLNGGLGTNDIDGGDGTDDCFSGEVTNCETGEEPEPHPESRTSEDADIFARRHF